VGTISLITTILSVVKLLIQWSANRGLLDAGAAQAALNGVEETDNAIKQATDARQRVRADLAVHPDGVREPDEFQRKD